MIALPLPTLFISYTSRDDRDRLTAHRLATGLRSLNARVWIAPDSIPAGDEWREALIRQVLSESTHFLVVLSRTSTGADWVLAEIALAAERHAADPDFRILPLVTGKLGRYPGRQFINRFQRVPYHDSFAVQLAEVARAVGLAGELPPDVAELIAEKTEDFVGRKNVFSAIEEFVGGERNGYFTIEGDPGAGKTTILAEYVRRTGCVAHFNVRGQSLNTSSYFVRTLGSHLAARYGIAGGAQSVDHDRSGETLARLLIEARASLGSDEPLVLVVDALDEVDPGADPPGANILLLPRHLPRGVYFLMSSRRASVPLATDAPSRTYDLGQHHTDTMTDIREYLRQMAGQERLRRWLDDRSIPLDTFVDVLAGKCEGNFMYLRYVLPELAQGSYRDLDIRRLPQGLERYYDTHWQVMGMAAGPTSRLPVWVLYLLCELARPVSIGLLVAVLKEIEPSIDAIAVHDVLRDWQQFLRRDESAGGTKFSLYHTSFGDFLHRKDTVAAAGLALRDVNGVIADVLWRHEYESEYRS